MENNLSSQHIRAVAVNHNTSKYTELMLRSLLARHPRSLDCSVIVIDNNSQDDRTELEAYAQRKSIPIVPSGLELTTKHNSHGEVLRQFVVDHPDCAYYLFLDADVCFLEDNTIDTMVLELGQNEMAFGISPRLSANAETEIMEEYWSIYTQRLHPCCALVKNTAVFRRVVEEVGLSCVQYLWAKGEEHLDTFQLMTKVMKTHGFTHIRSSKVIQHFFSVSYEWEPPVAMEFKAKLRDKLLAGLRNQEPG